MRQELLRSGPLARLRKTEREDDLAYPRQPGPFDPGLPQPRAAGRAVDDQRRFARLPRAILPENTSSDRQSFHHGGEPAVHGGSILLEYPQNLKDIGFSTDYEVVKLQTTTNDGHRLLTLRLRTSPAVKGRDREDCTFVFDADDLFVVRSMHYGEPFRCSFRITNTIRVRPSAGRPVLRSWRRSNTAKYPTLRLDVKECRFGPIPESEFALDRSWPASGRTGSSGSRVEAPTATLLDWYWLAFVCGGISLAGGSGLALGSRHRDRRALRAE